MIRSIRVLPAVLHINTRRNSFLSLEKTENIISSAAGCKKIHSLEKKKRRKEGMHIFSLVVASRRIFAAPIYDTRIYACPTWFWLDPDKIQNSYSFQRGIKTLAMRFVTSWLNVSVSFGPRYRTATVSLTGNQKFKNANLFGFVSRSK